MTSTTDTTGHPDVAELSDLTEGLLPPSRSEDVQRHLDACEPCADVHASLEEIRGLLGGVPAPAQMPEDIARRIDAALAAEARLTPTAPETPVSRETSTRVDRPAGRPYATTGPGRKGRTSRGRRRTVALGAALTAAVLGAGALFLQSLDHGRSAATAQGRQTAAADTLSENRLKGEVTDLLSAEHRPRRGSDSQKPSIGVESEPNTPESTASVNTLIQPSVSVPNCVRQGISSQGVVLGAKKGTYGGKDAYLVVLPEGSDTTRVTAYVVDTTCVGRKAASPGKVLLKRSFARP
ncbi:anti-sigma factor [Streptomyces sp. V3I7]|uniref:anti-sigma factor family protein n=1 Tax=Streptomyces sp. V3I7 TaxID=3042278 RepID=UPI002781C44A|nr:zf-HC2 domain-containing protein [Streptomyces sp. V3I7]MDQ0991870.1 hypothetical protein [Streptomyces sp. V3I7]